MVNATLANAPTLKQADGDVRLAWRLAVRELTDHDRTDSMPAVWGLHG